MHVKTVEKSRDNKFVFLILFSSFSTEARRRRKEEGENKEVELLFRRQRQCAGNPRNVFFLFPFVW